MTEEQNSTTPTTTPSAPKANSTSSSSEAGPAAAKPAAAKPAAAKPAAAKATPAAKTPAAAAKPAAAKAPPPAKAPVSQESPPAKGSDPEFGKLTTVDELIDAYNEMVLTAIDLRIRGVSNAKSFPDVKTGVLACERLHAQIVKTREPKESKMATKKGAAKKGGAKKAKAKDSGERKERASFADEAKIQWLNAEGNPCREGSGRYDRVELVRKASGKTFKTFSASGGRAATLKRCVEEGWAKVT